MTQKQQQQLQQHQFKYQQNNLPHARKLNKLKGRYMTDPLSAKQKDRIQDNDSAHNKLPKRNSLNDRIESQTSSSPTSPNNQQSNGGSKILTKTMHGDSTSTLMSTDSGVSSTSYGGHQSTSRESILPEYKLSEEEVEDIFKEFVKTDTWESENENLTKIISPINDNSIVNDHPHLEENLNRSADYFEMNPEFDDSKPNLNSHVTSPMTIRQNFENKSLKWQKDNEATKIPMVIGQINCHSDVNNNNVQSKFSPQVFTSFSLSTHDNNNNTSTFKKSNSKRNPLEKTIFRYDGQLNKFKTTLSTQHLNNKSIMTSNDNLNNSNEDLITHTNTKQSNSSYFYNNPEARNEENEIHIIASQKPTIARLSSTRGISSLVEKRCATPVDYLYIQQNEIYNNKNQTYIENYDSSIKSGFNNKFRYTLNQQHKQKQNQQQQFVNLLHTTPDAT